MSKLLRSGLLLAALSLGACSVAGTYVPPAAGAPAATLVGEDAPLWSNPSPLGLVGKTRFTRVNDDTLPRSAWSGYPSQLRVPPGKHYVEVQGELRMDGRSWAHGSQAFYEAFEAGRTYYVSVRPAKKPGEVELVLAPVDPATGDS